MCSLFPTSVFLFMLVKPKFFVLLLAVFAFPGFHFCGSVDFFPDVLTFHFLTCFSQVNEGVRMQENSDRLESLQRNVQMSGLKEVCMCMVMAYIKGAWLWFGSASLALKFSLVFGDIYNELITAPT